ncbi:29 kDa ribonucleoprotein A, chloroplastic [Abrus precatorius]|uniref:29 kDa ribonucleoprotein A, chloroplastic n=1 Tax=Abrus precatorius TaxID=3816 RepID=A0A8B8LXB9_ABRPR|nr:29 kDa ribonucleoprotein A, chloroplastic [Abrus precatorius]
MATLELALTVFAPQRLSHNYGFHAKAPQSIKLNTSIPFSSLVFSSKTPTLCFHLCSALQEVAATEETQDQTQLTNNVKKKLYVVNLPWSMSASDIKDLFAQCGNVTDVEIIKNKDGRSRGYAFVTMASGEEALAAVDKFDSQEISGRIIRVELAKRFKKPPSPRPPGPRPGEARHVLYASNLAWKARSIHLKQVFTENFKTPVSARVVFDSPSGRSAGYGFVSFLTREEAEAAISALDGKDLMGRPLRLKFSEKKVEEAGSEKDEDQGSEDQIEEAESDEDEDQGHDDAQLE